MGVIFAVILLASALLAAWLALGVGRGLLAAARGLPHERGPPGGGPA